MIGWKCFKSQRWLCNTEYSRLSRLSCVIAQFGAYYYCTGRLSEEPSLPEVTTGCTLLWPPIKCRTASLLDAVRWTVLRFSVSIVRAVRCATKKRDCPVKPADTRTAHVGRLADTMLLITSICLKLCESAAGFTCKDSFLLVPVSNSHLFPSARPLQPSLKPGILSLSPPLPTFERFKLPHNPNTVHHIKAMMAHFSVQNDNSLDLCCHNVKLTHYLKTIFE